VFEFIIVFLLLSLAWFAVILVVLISCCTNVAQVLLLFRSNNKSFGINILDSPYKSMWNCISFDTNSCHIHRVCLRIITAPQRITKSRLPTYCLLQRRTLEALYEKVVKRHLKL